MVSNTRWSPNLEIAADMSLKDQFGFEENKRYRLEKVPVQNCFSGNLNVSISAISVLDY